MAFYGYARVSTERQSTEGASLGVQETILHGMAMQHQGELARIFREEGVSGSVHLSARPQGAAMLEGLRKGDVILATRLDRLFRSALDALQSLEDFGKRGVRVIFGDIGDTESANGRLMLTILAGVAEAERNIIRERIRAVKRAQNNQGRYLGGRLPFGHLAAADGSLTLTPEGARGRAEALRLREQGLSLRAIAAEMRARGWSISHMGVRHIVGKSRSPEA